MEKLYCYEQRIREVQHSLFTPLVFLAVGAGYSSQCVLQEAGRKAGAIVCEDHWVAAVYPQLFTDAVHTHMHSGIMLNLEEA